MHGTADIIIKNVKVGNKYMAQKASPSTPVDTDWHVPKHF